MFNSSFLLIILLAFKHTHLISSLDVLPCIPLRLQGNTEIVEILIYFRKVVGVLEQL